MTATATETTTGLHMARVTEPGDGPVDAAHMVVVPEGELDETPQAYCLRATVEGFPVTALCGYTWVPSKDPRDKPVCSACMDIYQGLVRPDQRDDLPEA